MLFSEHDSEWMPIQPWMDFLIQFGYGWRSEPASPRRIALISMPCDSAAAGLIVLGALIRDLTIPSANDVDGHYERLLQKARQYLKYCRQCDLVCEPDEKECGFLKQSTGKLRSPLLTGTVEISDRTNFEERQIVWLQRDGYRNHCLVRPTPQHARNYHLEDEPPVQWHQSDASLAANAYRELLNLAAIFPDNLSRSYSGLCLAGRAVGENASRDVCSRVKFSNGAGEYGLDRLLTVHDWSDGALSRVAFFNPRTTRLDRHVAAPHLVVADGDASFLKVADRHEFQQSDLVGVIHRTTERDGLEAVGARLTAWRQWYDFDEEMLCGLPPVPRGVSITILRKRG